MKFKVVKGTKTFNKLSELKNKVVFVNQEAENLVKTLGGKRYCKHQHVLAGGIAAIEFDSKPDDYKIMGEKYQNLYYPKVSNKKDCKLIQELPTLDYKELNSLVNFNGPQTIPNDHGFGWVSTVGIIWGEDEILIEVPSGCKYTPPEDLIEIVESEYEKLKEKNENNGDDK